MVVKDTANMPLSSIAPVASSRLLSRSLSGKVVAISQAVVQLSSQGHSEE